MNESHKTITVTIRTNQYTRCFIIVNLVKNTEFAHL